LTDDGKAPDNVANDGVYSGYYYYAENACYDITVQMDNRKKTAKFTSKNTRTLPTVLGTRLRRKRIQKVGQAFVRTARFSVTTSGGVFAQNLLQLPKGTYATTIESPDFDHAHSGALQITLGKSVHSVARCSMRGRPMP
jgi:hypothetical protein